jgi:tetratricopeptide (TPR) repeat protein
LEEGWALYRRGDFQGAIAKYGEFVQQNPHSPDGYAGLLRTHLKQKNVEQAEATLQQGLAQTDSPRLHVARGEIWFRQGRIVDAEKEWAGVINSGYPEARAYLGLSRVRNAVAMYKGAKQMIDKARELDHLDPDIEEAWTQTLTRAERIKYLQDRLAGENNWSGEERESVKNYLEYLQERAKRNNGSCRLVSSVTSTETPLTVLRSGWGLSVALNGYNSSLVLDTGASGILVSRSVAQRAGISKISDTKIGGIGNKGFRKGYVGVADSIKIGHLEFRDCPVEVMQGRSVAETDGLIGADVFESFLIDIDFLNRKLTLGQLPRRPGEAAQKLQLKTEGEDSEESRTTQEDDNGKPADKKGATAQSPAIEPQDRYIAPEMQSYTQVFRFGHDLLVPTSIGDVPPRLFLLDSGAMDNIISLSAAREVTKVRSSATELKGLSGNVKNVYSAKNVELSFGHVRHPDTNVLSFDTKPLSDDVGTEISGILGLGTFYYLDIKIDYRDALVDFKYDAKQWDHSRDPKK